MTYRARAKGMVTATRALARLYGYITHSCRSRGDENGLDNPVNKINKSISFRLVEVTLRGWCIHHGWFMHLGWCILMSDGSSFMIAWFMKWHVSCRNLIGYWIMLMIQERGKWLFSVAHDSHKSGSEVMELARSLVLGESVGHARHSRWDRNLVYLCLYYYVVTFVKATVCLWIIVHIFIMF